MAPNRSTYFLPQEQFDDIKKKYPKFNEPWTEDDESLLYELADRKATRKEMSETLGRTQRSIKMKLLELGLYDKTQQVRPWKEDEERKLVSLYNEGVDFENIALELNRSVKAILSRLVLLRIRLFDNPEVA